MLSGFRSSMTALPRFAAVRAIAGPTTQRLLGASEREFAGSRPAAAIAAQLPTITPNWMTATGRKGEFAAFGCSHSAGGVGARSTCRPTPRRPVRASSFRVDRSLASATTGRRLKAAADIHLKFPRFRGHFFTQERVRDTNLQTAISGGVSSTEGRTGARRSRHRRSGPGGSAATPAASTPG